LTVPDGGVVLSRPRPILGCSAHDDDNIFICNVLNVSIPEFYSFIQCIAPTLTFS
jgi:hypothetical protein